MESNALEESTNNSVALRIFARIPSMIRRMIGISDVVGRFLGKPFWFYLRIFLISGRIQLKSRELQTLASYASVVIRDSDVVFLGEGEDVAFCPFVVLC